MPASTATRTSSPRPTQNTPAKITCATCHADEQTAYSHSYHATAKKPDGGIPATCSDCHGDAHTVLPASDPKSKIYHSNIPATCGACHGQKFLMESTGNSAQPFVSYQESVHGRAVANGSQQAAVCTDCHGAHDILPANDAKSLINKFNVPATCGRCHAGVQHQYTQSIHGQAISRGNSLAPVCTDCHGIHYHPHRKRRAGSPSNRQSADQSLTRDSCAGCHQGVRLTQEFGVAGNRVSSYLDSYHGSPRRAAPSSRPTAPVATACTIFCPPAIPAPLSIPPTSTQPAGKCHKGVTTKFTRAKVHVDIEGGARQRRRYGSGAMGPLVLHSAHPAGHRRHAAAQRHPVARQDSCPPPRTGAPGHVRMTPNQRWQHLVLLSSFFVLVVTGFALSIRTPGSPQCLALSEHWRSIIHRIAGVALIADGIYHVFYVAFTPDGRKLICDLSPCGKTPPTPQAQCSTTSASASEKPKYARFNYAEKAEYWALVWGTALMAVTGIMLWAKVPVGNLLARWWIDAATAVHFYEAILATLAILVWHFYQVFFDPDVYPMNWAWRDGSMSAEHYREEHPLDTETLAEAGSPKDIEATPGSGPPQE